MSSARRWLSATQEAEPGQIQLGLAYVDILAELEDYAGQGHFLTQRALQYKSGFRALSP